jgi:acyl-coenzyme A thioesterase PaaI-like protein
LEVVVNNADTGPFAPVERTTDDHWLEAHEALRTDAAAALRDLVHAFVGHDCDEAALVAIRDWARSETATLFRSPPRSRMLLMQRVLASAGSGEWTPGGSAGFEDRAVAGRANPTGLVFDTWREGDMIVADVTLGAAFEGAPGRAHGGIVAAAFDDLTGAIIGVLQEPAFTGELTVRFVQPVPVQTPLRLRTWLDTREGRKLHIHADAHAGEQLVATCKAVYITVDPLTFAGAPDPR